MKHLLRLTLLTVFAIAGCAPAAAPTSGTSTTGSAAPAEKRSDNQVLKIAQVGLPASPSPESSATQTQVFYALYDNVVTLDDKFNVVPSVAERWEQPNPTTWRLFIRKDMTFSNGDKLTAADVEFTGKFILDRKTPQLPHISSVVDVRLVDEYTVDFINKSPDASTLAGLSYAWVLPKKYFDSVGRDGFAAKPVGSGPYDLVEFRSADIARFKLRSTPHAFRKPNATELSIRSITQPTAVIAGLQTGELDIALGQFTADQLVSVRKLDAVVHKRLIASLTLLFPYTEMQRKPAQTADKRVRQALNYAIDKEAIAKSFYAGDAQISGQLGPPNSPFWNPDIKPYPYDPAKAKQLLAEAGYPNGFKMAMGIDFTASTANADVMAAIQGNLRDIGVDAPVTSHELGIFLDKFYNRNGQSKGDLFASTVPDPNGFNTTVRGRYSCTAPPENLWWCNTEFDKLSDAANVESDLAKRSALMRQAAKVLTDDVAHVYLLAVPSYVIHNSKIRGFVWASDSFYNFDSAYRVE